MVNRYLVLEENVAPVDGERVGKAGSVLAAEMIGRLPWPITLQRK